jgi:two-component system, OmpR family, sensor kinase
VTAFFQESRLPRLGRRSLTARIVVGVVALVLILVIAVGGATYFALRSFLNDRLGQQLDVTARRNAAFLSTCTGTPIPNRITCTGSPSTQDEWVAVIQQQPLAWQPVESQYMHALQLNDEVASTLAQNPGQVATVSQDGYSLIVTARLIRPDVLAVTGLSTADIDRTTRRLLLLEISIGGAAVLVAVLATSWGVQRSLRHLYQVTGTAREVAAELSPEGRGLDRRVPVTEEGTEVAQLAESMNTLLGAVETQFAARLESEDRMRQFLADASHELRTPLTSIRGYAELARMQRDAGAAAEDNLARIESEGTRMSRLVEDLLLLARGDADPASQAENFEPITVADLLDDVVSNARAAFPQREIHLQVVDAPVVVGDRDQLMRVVSNLVTNAAVHTDESRPITVRAFVDPATSDGTTVQVIDSGPGLAPEQAAHVFERFWRADKARSRARGGTGLGMAIVAAIVRTHGGTVRFDSDVERGSTVTVWLPSQPPVAR